MYRPKSNFSNHVCETIGSPKCKPVRSKACRGELGLPLSSLKPRTVYYNAHPTSPLGYTSYPVCDGCGIFSEGAEGPSRTGITRASGSVEPTARRQARVL